MNILSDPSIGNDGTVYISTWFLRGGTQYTNVGYIHAIGKIDPNAPSSPSITGSTNGQAGIEYEYTIISNSPLGKKLYYFIDWDDETVEKWFGPYSSGSEVMVNHTWLKKGSYKIKARAKDSDNLWGQWNELNVSMPRIRTSDSYSIFSFLERFPTLLRLLLLLG
jgi:hypothetical protein